MTISFTVVDLGLEREGKWRKGAYGPKPDTSWSPVLTDGIQALGQACLLSTEHKQWRQEAVAQKPDPTSVIATGSQSQVVGQLAGEAPASVGAMDPGVRGPSPRVLHHLNCTQRPTRSWRSAARKCCNDRPPVYRLFKDQRGISHQYVNMHATARNCGILNPGFRQANCEDSGAGT